MQSIAHDINLSDTSVSDVETTSECHRDLILPVHNCTCPYCTIHRCERDGVDYYASYVGDKIVRVDTCEGGQRQTYPYHDETSYDGCDFDEED
jgi:hypothetical protein